MPKNSNTKDSASQDLKKIIADLHREHVEKEVKFKLPLHRNQPYLIVHVAVQSQSLHRIWANSVHIYCHQTPTRHKLQGMLNVSTYPALTPYSQTSVYTLLFDRPGPECKTFTIREDIPEFDGLLIENIERNNIDVYVVDH